MSWLYETRILASDKNENIKCERMFGRWSVSVNNTQQTSPYVTDLWRTSIKRIPQDAKIRRILVLGLGAGGCLVPLIRRFPKSHIVGIEWDGKMIALMKELGFATATGRLEIIIDDVSKALPRLTGKFDLVIFDLFIGPAVSEIVASDGLKRCIGNLLDVDGRLIINAFTQPSLLDGYASIFTRTAEWKYLANHMAMFERKKDDSHLPQLAAGYLPYRACSEYLKKECGAGPSFRFIRQQSGICGIGWNIGPLKFEKYYTDEEPIVAKSTLCIWQPLTRIDVPRGWWRSHGSIGTSLTGYVENVSEASSVATWSKHAQRQLSAWKRCGLRVVEITLEEFLKGAASSTLPRSWKRSLEVDLPKKIASHGDGVRLYGIYDNPDTCLMAGLAVIDVLDISQSIHLASFINPAARKLPYGVGLIHHWHVQSLVKGIRFLDFDQLWAPGESKSWEGFSNFKRQFGLRYIRYPKTLLRLRLS